MQLIVVETTGGSSAVQLSTKIDGTGAKVMHMQLLNADAPDVAPAGVATIHLSSADPATTPGYFLTSNSSSVTITGDPAALWLSVHNDSEFVQIFVE